jgi:hypothetical protein
MAVAGRLLRAEVQALHNLAGDRQIIQTDGREVTSVNVPELKYSDKVRDPLLLSKVQGGVDLGELRTSVDRVVRGAVVDSLACEAFSFLLVVRHFITPYIGGWFSGVDVHSEVAGGSVDVAAAFADFGDPVAFDFVDVLPGLKSGDSFGYAA